MTDQKTKRSGIDRRDSKNQKIEEYIKFFIPEDEEKRSGKDRRKSESNN